MGINMTSSMTATNYCSTGQEQQEQISASLPPTTDLVLSAAESSSSSSEEEESNMIIRSDQEKDIPTTTTTTTTTIAVAEETPTEATAPTDEDDTNTNNDNVVVEEINDNTIDTMTRETNSDEGVTANTAAYKDDSIIEHSNIENDDDNNVAVVKNDCNGLAHGTVANSTCITNPTSTTELPITPSVQEPAAVEDEELAQEPAAIEDEELAQEPPAIEKEELAQEPAAIEKEELAQEPAAIEEEETTTAIAPTESATTTNDMMVGDSVGNGTVENNNYDSVQENIIDETTNTTITTTVDNTIPVQNEQQQQQTEVIESSQVLEITAVPSLDDILITTSSTTEVRNSDKNVDENGSKSKDSLVSDIHDNDVLDEATKISDTASTVPVERKEDEVKDEENTTTSEKDDEGVPKMEEEAGTSTIIQDDMVPKQQSTSVEHAIATTTSLPNDNQIITENETVDPVANDVNVETKDDEHVTGTNEEIVDTHPIVVEQTILSSEQQQQQVEEEENLKQQSSIINEDCKVAQEEDEEEMQATIDTTNFSSCKLPAASLTQQHATTKSHSTRTSSTSGFVNTGLAAWEGNRTRWLAKSYGMDRVSPVGVATVITEPSTSSSSSLSSSATTTHPTNQKQQQHRHAVPLNVDDIIDIIFAAPTAVASTAAGGQKSIPIGFESIPKFPRPVPLPQMVDILQDLWEAEGLDV